MTPILSAEQVTKNYVIGERRIAVLDGVTFDIHPGEFVVIMGSSGSGKSTLLSVLSGLDQPSQGRIRIDGVDVTDWSEDRLAPIRNSTFGFVFQSFHLVPSLNALENVAFPAELRGDRDGRQRARTLLERVGLGARMTNFPHQLSGGEKQRVAIARALVTTRRSSLPTNRPAISTRRTARGSSTCSSNCTASATPRWCWSPMHQKSQSTPDALSHWPTAKW